MIRYVRLLEIESSDEIRTGAAELNHVSMFQPMNSASACNKCLTSLEYETAMPDQKVFMSMSIDSCQLFSIAAYFLRKYVYEYVKKKISIPPCNEFLRLQKRLLN